MSKEYKVWVHVEEVDEDEDIYEDQGIPHVAGVFDTVEAAEKYAEYLAYGVSMVV